MLEDFFFQSVHFFSGVQNSLYELHWRVTLVFHGLPIFISRDDDGKIIARWKRHHKSNSALNSLQQRHHQKLKTNIASLFHVCSVYITRMKIQQYFFQIDTIAIFPPKPLRHFVPFCHNKNLHKKLSLDIYRSHSNILPRNIFVLCSFPYLQLTCQRTN